jgi:hypothetical protein
MFGGSLLSQRSVRVGSYGNEILDKQLVQPYKKIINKHTIDLKNVQRNKKREKG